MGDIAMELAAKIKQFRAAREEATKQADLNTPLPDTFAGCSPEHFTQVAESLLFEKIISNRRIHYPQNYPLLDIRNVGLKFVFARPDGLLLSAVADSEGKIDWAELNYQYRSPVDGKTVENPLRAAGIHYSKIHGIGWASLNCEDVDVREGLRVIVEALEKAPRGMILSPFEGREDYFAGKPEFVMNWGITDEGTRKAHPWYWEMIGRNKTYGLGLP